MNKLTVNQLALYLGAEAQISLYGKQRPNLIITGETLYDLEVHQRDYPDQEISIKPLLRPLNDMTEEEAQELTETSKSKFSSNFGVKDFKFKEWLHLDESTMSKEGFVYISNHRYELGGKYMFWFSRDVSFDGTVYLLSKGFDLFNWIEQGLAVSKPAIGIEAAPSASEGTADSPAIAQNNPSS